MVMVVMMMMMMVFFFIGLSGFLPFWCLSSPLFQHILPLATCTKICLLPLMLKIACCHLY